MSLIRNLFFLSAITIFATASTVLAIFNYNPFVADAKILTNFYVSLFFTLSGIIALVIYYIKTRVVKNQSIYKTFWPSIRQASLLSAAITTLLFLKGLDILDWLIGISIVIISVMLEFFFQSKKVAL